MALSSPFVVAFKPANPPKMSTTSFILNPEYVFLSSNIKSRYFELSLSSEGPVERYPDY